MEAHLLWELGIDVARPTVILSAYHKNILSGKIASLSPNGCNMLCRLAVSTLLIAALFPSISFADAFKCRTGNGRTVISSTPCDETETSIRVQRSDNNIPAYQQQNAIDDLERQKQYLRMREREQQSSVGYTSTSSPHQGTGNAYDPDTRDRIHACLMKITATTGISSGEAARRKVNCYSGTRGLGDECEGRITATGGLTTQQENQFRAQCRSINF